MTQLSPQDHQNTSATSDRFLKRILVSAQKLAQPALVQLLLRIAIAVPFWKSGILKWDGLFKLNETAVDLFTYEFQLHLPGGPYPYPAPEVFAFLSACGEVLLPVLLIAGLATRFAAIGIVLMTCVIELTIPEGWPVHLTWAAMALAVVRWGPGYFSLDYWLGDRGYQSSKK